MGLKVEMVALVAGEVREQQVERAWACELELPSVWGRPAAVGSGRGGASRVACRIIMA